MPRVLRVNIRFNSFITITILIITTIILASRLNRITCTVSLGQVSQPPVIHGYASAMTRVLLPRPLPGKTLRNGHHSLCVGLTCLNSIAVSIFVDIMVELTNTISEFQDPNNPFDSETRCFVKRTFPKISSGKAPTSLESNSCLK